MTLSAWQSPPIREDGWHALGSLGIALPDVSDPTLTTEALNALLAALRSAGVLAPVTANHLLLDGSPGTYAWTDDKASLDLTGPLDLRIADALDDWAPSSDAYHIVKWGPDPSSFPYLLVSDVGGGPGELSFETLGNGYPSQQGMAESANPTVNAGYGQSPNISNGTPACIRTAVIDLGTGNFQAIMYYKLFVASDILAQLDADDGWYELRAYSDYYSFHPSPTDFTDTPFPATTEPLVIGASSDDLNNMSGKVYAAVVKNELGDTVASPDFTAQEPGTTEFTDAQGNVWHLAGNAQIVGP